MGVHSQQFCETGFVKIMCGGCVSLANTCKLPCFFILWPSALKLLRQSTPAQDFCVLLLKTFSTNFLTTSHS